MRTPAYLLLLAAAGLVAAEGYTDTPLIPGTQWHVHDSARPQPPRADKDKLKCNLEKAPAGAVELITGADSSANWEPDNGAKGKHWPIRDGVMFANGNGIHTKQSFMRTYELQVLDCSKTETYADGMTAAIYGQQPPAFNACNPSREWNSYDIQWTAPTFDEAGKVATKARITVVMNGVKVQDGVEYIGPSSHKKNPPYAKHAAQLPLGLQWHGDVVEFRNMWILPATKAAK